MKGKRHTTEQKIRDLREAERAGITAVDVCRAHQISEQTFHRWKRSIETEVSKRGRTPIIESARIA